MKHLTPFTLGTAASQDDLGDRLHLLPDRADIDPVALAPHGLGAEVADLVQLRQHRLQLHGCLPAVNDLPTFHTHAHAPTVNNPPLNPSRKRPPFQPMKEICNLVILLSVIGLFILASVGIKREPAGPTEAEKKRASDNAFSIYYEKAIMNNPNLTREEKHELLKTVPSKRMK
jgi:hypothetical protein